MEHLEKAVIGQLVAQNYHTAAVFRQYNIDFCCNGNRTVEEACRQKSIDTAAVKAALESVLAVRAAGSEDYNSWGLIKLADHIVQKHHGYVSTQIPVLQAYLHKLGSVHGQEHPELRAISQLFNECAGELAAHMKKEELVLFPYIRQLLSVPDGATPPPPAFGSISNPIAMMMTEHDHEGERFRKIQELSNGYTVPPDGCNTYRVTYALLKEFQDDLHLHIHLENNILFPKAAGLEEQLAAAGTGNSCSIQRR